MTKLREKSSPGSRKMSLAVRTPFMIGVAVSEKNIWTWKNIWTIPSGRNGQRQVDSVQASDGDPGTDRQVRRGEEGWYYLYIISTRLLSIQSSKLITFKLLYTPIIDKNLSRWCPCPRTPSTASWTRPRSSWLTWASSTSTTRTLSIQTSWSQSFRYQ